MKLHQFSVLRVLHSFEPDRRYRLIYRYNDRSNYRVKCTNANFEQLIQEIASIINLGIIDFMVHLQDLECDYTTYPVASDYDCPTSYDEYLGNV